MPATHVERDAVITPEARQEIEAVLSAFRQWLLESERGRDVSFESPEVALDTVAQVDLHTLLGEWMALKTELNLAARGSKASREQLDQAVDEFRQGVDRVGQEAKQLLDPLVRERDRLRDGVQAKLDATEQKWIAALLDVREALARGVAASRQAHRRLGWRGWFLPRGLFGGLLEGCDSSLRRIDAALESCGIQPIECDGRPVDPELMRVVDVVRRDDLPAGQVVEVIRRGYVRSNRVIRHAEVRAVVVGPSDVESKRDDPAGSILPNVPLSGD